MTEDKDPLLPGEDMVIQAAAEAAFLSAHEQVEHKEVVEELLDELVDGASIDLQEREQLLEMFDQSIRIARGKVDEGARPLPVQVDTGKIDWIPGAEVVEVAGERVASGELTYRFVDLTDLSRIPSECRRQLSRQYDKSGKPVLPKLMSALKETGLPALYRDIKSGSGLRPRTRKGGKTGKETAATDYPAYKIGVQGTNNRAIVLLLEDASEEPVLGLAVLYDHASEHTVYRVIG